MRTSNAAKLPALPSVSTGNAALDKWVQAVTERLEVREGMRGNPNERAVTVRDMRDAGVSAFTTTSTTPGSVLTVNADGTYSTMTPDAFAESIRSSKLYKDLMKRLDDVTRFDGLPDQVKAVLLTDLAEEAAKRGADIRRLENKLQSTAESLAYTVEEVTAAVEGSVAGVRETVFASATETNATAGKVTQLVAALDGTGSATIEESMIVIADRTEGLRSQAMLKLNAGKAVTAVGLMASEDPTGATESKFIVQADQFALTGTYTYMQGDASSTPPVTPPLATTAGETWYNTRTNLSYRAAGGLWVEYTQPIPFGVDMTTNTTYINGTLRVGSAGGMALEDITSGVNGTSYGMAYAYKRSATDLIAIWAPTTNGPGAITWTFAAGAITTPATDALLNGWTKAIPAGTDPLYVTVCSAAGGNPTDDIAATEWAAPVILAQSGANGLNVATAILYQRNSSATVAPAAQANSVTYTFATGGMTGMSAGWTAAIPAASSGAYLWVTRATASATTATDTLAAGEWSAPVLYTQDGMAGVSFAVTPTSLAYQVTRAGVGSPSSISFGQIASGLPSDLRVRWTSSPPASGFAGVTYDLATGPSLSYADFATAVGSANTVTLTATLWNSAAVGNTQHASGLVEKVTLVRLYEGAAGISAVLSNETHNFTASNTGAVSSYTGSGTLIRVYEGATELVYDGVGTAAGGWKVVATPIGITTGTLTDSGSYLTVGNHSGMADASDTASISYAISGKDQLGVAFTMTKLQTFSKAKTGTTGTRGTVTAYGTASAWSDTTANSAITTATGSATKVIGDTVILSNGTSFAQTRYWSGSAWITAGLVVDGNAIVSGTLAASALVANSITATQLATTGVITSTLQVGSNLFTVPERASSTSSTTINNSVQTVVLSKTVNFGTVATSGCHVSVTLQMIAPASPTNIVTYVQLFIDTVAGDQWALVHNNTTPISFSWSQANAFAGSHTFEVKVYRAEAGWTCTNKVMNIMATKR